jgi:pimeloyl-ACP methyl ester carboxylesterase
MDRLVMPIVAALLMGPSAQQPARGVLVEHVSCPNDPAQTYTLYLPSTYQTTRNWPLLLVFDPGGRGARAAEVFREAAERFGWIIAASENSRNGPWEPTLRAVNAMWPALLGGYAVDERRVYTAGHSGGATVAWLVAQQTGQIAGVIASGQPNPESQITKAKEKRFAWFGAAGHSDFNFLQVKNIDAALADSTSPHRLDFFDGGHQWPPTEITFRALGWMEVVSMKEGRRSRDLDLVRTILADDVARARALEDRGLLTEAWRSYGTIVATYTSLVDVGDAERRRRAIETDSRFKNSRKLEERADRGEQQEIYAVGKVAARLAEENPPLVAELRAELNLDSLEKASRGEGYEAASATRSIALVRIQLSTMAREMRDKHDVRADLVQKVLDSIK